MNEETEKEVVTAINENCKHPKHRLVLRMVAQVRLFDPQICSKFLCEICGKEFCVFGQIIWANDSYQEIGLGH